MGIRERGYRHWEGTYTGHAMRWWTVAVQGLRATIYSKPRLVVLILFMFLIWSWYLFLGLFWFFFAEVQFRDALIGTSDEYLRNQLTDTMKGWSYLVVPIFIATVGAPLVANDLRSNALYIYLAKPMRRVDYILGKTATIVLWALPVTLLPNLFVFLSASLSGDANTKLQDPTEILLEILAVQGLFLLVLTTAVLAVSSLTKRWQAALLAFLGGYFVLEIISQVIVGATQKRDWFYVSVAGNVKNIAEEIFERASTRPDWELSLAFVLALSAIGFGLFLWRMLKLEVAE